MPNDLRAASVMRNNVLALLDARKESQAELARWLKHDRSWINKFLNGERQIQLKDLDRVAQFFGIATYQLFQPGISALTERRVQPRRKGRDRRVGHQMREADAVRRALTEPIKSLKVSRALRQTAPLSPDIEGSPDHGVDSSVSAVAQLAAFAFKLDQLSQQIAALAASRARDEPAPSRRPDAATRG